MKTLHIVRTQNDTLPLDLINRKGAPGSQTLLLIHDGVYRTGPFPDKTYASQRDAEARGVIPGIPLIGDVEICRLIIEHDKAIVW